MPHGPACQRLCPNPPLLPCASLRPTWPLTNQCACSDEAAARLMLLRPRLLRGCPDGTWRVSFDASSRSLAGRCSTLSYRVLQEHVTQPVWLQRFPLPQCHRPVTSQVSVGVGPIRALQDRSEGDRSVQHDQAISGSYQSSGERGESGA